MKVIIISCLVALCHAVSYEDLFRDEWNLFKVQFNKQYQNKTEENYRMNIFMENKLKILRHNKRYENGLVSFRMKVTRFADMTNREFVRTMNGYKRSTSVTSGTPLNASTFVPPENMVLPSSIDWREKGAVTKVKDQGNCGSCYSFSSKGWEWARPRKTDVRKGSGPNGSYQHVGNKPHYIDAEYMYAKTGSIEGQHFRKTGKLVSLSEQNIIDCSQDYGNAGCGGGFMENSFKYIKDNDGIDTEESYPYEEMSKICIYDPKNKGATVTGYVTIPEGSEDKLMAAVATQGPVSVGIDAEHESFQHYAEGVYYEPACVETDMTHAVLVVGYGVSAKGEDYWIVKNSFGECWGDKGYIMMSRNKNNNCGIATIPIYPLV